MIYAIIYLCCFNHAKKPPSGGWDIAMNKFNLALSLDQMKLLESLVWSEYQKEINAQIAGKENLLDSVKGTRQMSDSILRNGTKCGEILSEIQAITLCGKKSNLI